MTPTETIHKECKTELQVIRELVENAFGVDLLAESTKRHLADKRKIYSKLCRENTFYSYSAIGREIKRDHATIINHLKQFDALYEYDNYFKRDYDVAENLVPEFFKIGKQTQRQLESKLNYHLTMVSHIRNEIKQLDKCKQKEAH